MQLEFSIASNCISLGQHIAFALRQAARSLVIASRHIGKSQDPSVPSFYDEFVLLLLFFWYLLCQRLSSLDDLNGLLISCSPTQLFCVFH